MRTVPAAGVNFDGKVDAQDETDYLQASLAWKSDHDEYDPRADLDRDGEVGDDDDAIFYDSYRDRPDSNYTELVCERTRMGARARYSAMASA